MSQASEPGAEGEFLGHQYEGWPQTTEHDAAPELSEQQLPACHSEVKVTGGAHTSAHTHERVRQGPPAPLSDPLCGNSNTGREV